MVDAGVPQMLRNHPPLLARVHDFNCHIARHIEPQRLTEFVPEAACVALLDSRRGEQKLSRWAIEHWKLSREGLWDFQEPRRRIALLTPKPFQQLVSYLAATIFTTQISRAIDRRTQALFKETLGDQAYTFAIKRAPLLNRFVPDVINQQVGEGQPSSEQLVHSGLLCIGALLADCPAELLRRTTLKVKTGLSIEPSRAVDADSQERLWTLVKRLTLTEISPEFAPCFN